jgi:hypothetical protein
MRLHFHFVLLLVGLFSGLAEAQSSSKSFGITGVVQDTSGAVIAGAYVALERPDGSDLIHTATSGTGEFQFKDLPPGSYLIESGSRASRRLKLTPGRM